MDERKFSKRLYTIETFEVMFFAL